MNAPKKSPEDQALLNRLNSAAMQMMDDPNLKLLWSNFVGGQIAEKNREALTKLRDAKTEAERIEAQVTAKTAVEIFNFKTKIETMAETARTSQEKPKAKP